jgi:hypothetical protein
MQIHSLTLRVSRRKKAPCLIDTVRGLFSFLGYFILGTPRRTKNHVQRVEKSSCRHVLRLEYISEETNTSSSWPQTVRTGRAFLIRASQTVRMLSRKFRQLLRTVQMVASDTPDSCVRQFKEFSQTVATFSPYKPGCPCRPSKAA